MFCLRYCNTVLILVLWSPIDARWLSPFDVRIDHHKVETSRDLIINTPRPRFSWKIRVVDNKSQRDVQQTAYQMQLESIKISQRSISFEWDSERVQSSQSIHVPYSGETDLSPSTYYRFRVRVWTTYDSTVSSEWTDWIRFRTPIFNLHQYLTENIGALWIGSRKINMNELRKEFIVPNTSPIVSAIVYVTGIGYYELYVNGERVDPSRKLDPGWTSYKMRVLLASFDLTANITTGKNAVGVKLGHGWYTAEQREDPAYGPPRLLFTLLITFQNGDQMQVISDQTWTGRTGSIKHDSVYNGEICDSRGDRPNWTRPGFSDPLSAWITPEFLPSPLNISANGSLALQDMPPIRAGLDALHFEVAPNTQQQVFLTAEDIGEIRGAKLTDGVLKPVAMWKSESGVTTFDVGQHITGWCRVKFRGPSGFGTYIRYGESIVQPVVSTGRSSRNIYTENLRRATASESYILRGEPAGEVYEPTFTVHGFRYLSVFGPPNSLTIDDVECPFVHSETILKGHFNSSNPIVNQIQHNVLWGQLSNIMSIPTDCAQRDERRGWLADAALAATQALYNFDLIKFYRNYLSRIADDQRSDGALSEFSPSSDNGSFPTTTSKYPAEANWGSALPTITWLIYLHYKDGQTLQDYYKNNVAYVDYLFGVYKQHGLIDFPCVFGDWVPPPPQNQTNLQLITSFAFLHDVYLLINMSQVLGRKNDTDIYSKLYQQLAEEFHRVFFNTSFNFYADGKQSAQVLALALPNVVPESVREAVVNQLGADINQKGIHVTTGIVSTARLYPVLSDNGHHDLALQLISSTTYPSYGYMFNNPYENATTLWERWDTVTEGPGMNSRNQAMYGSIGAWFYSHLAGIDLSSNIITIRPRMASEAKKHLMSKLHCQLSTLCGIVEVSYTRDERDTSPNSILLHVTIPPNTRSRVMFEPLFIGGKCKTLMEGDSIIWSSDSGGISMEEFEIEKDSQTDVIIVHAGSGKYEFQAVWN